MAGDIERLLAARIPRVVAGADDGIRVIGLGLAGRREEARAMLMEMQKTSRIPLFAAWIEYLFAWLDRHGRDMVAGSSRFSAFKIRSDPEGMFQEGWLLCDVGEYELGLDYLQRAVAKGYYPMRTLAERPQFDAIRDTPAFRALLAEAQAGHAQALAAFNDSGGARLVGAMP